MSDPERLLSSRSDLDDLERALLKSVQHVGPPEGAKGQAWDEIANKVAAAALIGTAISTAASSTSAQAAGAGASAAVKTSFGTALVAKIGWFVLGGAALSGGALWVQQATTASKVNADPSVPAYTKSIVTSQPAIASGTPAVVPDPAPVVEVPAAAENSNKPAVTPKRPDLLQAESQMLTEARKELRSGNAALAQTILNRMQQRFPQGMLGQEREVLSIEVLSARGSMEAAKRRARAFVSKYPQSPHSEKLQRFLP